MYFFPCVAAIGRHLHGIGLLMVPEIAGPELPPGGKGDGDGLVLIEMAQTGIVAHKEFDERLRAPQTGEVAAATMDIDGTEVHAVDIDDGEDYLSVAVVVPEDIAGGEVLMEDSLVVHVCREGGEGMGHGLIDLGCRRPHLIEEMAVGTLQRDEPALTQQTAVAVLQIGYGLRCVDMMLSEDRGIAAGPFTFWLAQAPGIDEDVEEPRPVEPLDDELFPIGCRKALDEVPLAAIHVFTLPVHPCGKGQEKIPVLLIARAEELHSDHIVCKSTTFLFGKQNIGTFFVGMNLLG